MQDLAPRRTHPAITALIAAALLAVFGSISAYVAQTVPLIGDEPHYIVIAHSLLVDHDLDLRNDYDQQVVTRYGLQPVDSHAREYHQPGVQRSIHVPGLGFFIMPALALAGVPGVLALCTVLWTLGVLQTYRAAASLVNSRRYALIATAGLVLTAPILFYSGRAFPDFAAVLPVSALFSRTFGDQRRFDTLITSVSLAALPWLHTRFAVIALILLGIGFWGRRDWRWIGVGALLFSLALQAGYFWYFYGSPNPAVLVDHSGDRDLLADREPRAIAGQIVDQEFGILPNAPLAFAALCSLPLLWRTRRGPALAIGAIFLSSVAVAGINHDWTGGFAFPLRYIAPALLLLAAPLAAAVEMTIDSSRWRALGGLLVAGFAGSLVVTAVMLPRPNRMLPYGIRDSFLLQDLGLLGTPLQQAWPSFVTPARPWRVIPPARLTGDVGTLRSDSQSGWGSVRYGDDVNDPSGFIVRQEAGFVRKGEHEFGIRFRAGQLTKPVGFVSAVVYAGGRSQEIGHVELRGAGLNAEVNQQLRFTYQGMTLFAAPAQLRFDIYFEGGSDLLIHEIGWHEPE